MDILEIFKKITKIPHCSKNTEKLKRFILDFAKKYGFNYEVDRANNILCYKSKRFLSFQAHYDMVCVGKAPEIKILEKDGFLYAKDSSLGADNGIGVAIMLHLISKGVEAEYLFTNDEEIGLIGAKNLDLNLKSQYMVNLDSEESDAIFIGCAGGIDIKAFKTPKTFKPRYKNFYEVSISNLPGGHSGVDIDKNIPNAIKELVFYLYDKDLELVSLKGGERINSIPSSAKAIVNADSLEEKNFKVKKVKEFDYVIDRSYIDLLVAFANGVRAYDNELSLPLDSINLALVDIDRDKVSIELSARSMKQENLNRLVIETKAYFKLFGFDIKTDSFYPPWEPKIGELAKKVQKLFKQENMDANFKAIHAGLESAIISQKFPNIQIVSIGPDIFNPHSTRERVKIDSIYKIANIVKSISIVV